MKFKAEDMVLPPTINESAWREWCEDRKERGKPLTKRAAVLSINKLLPFSMQVQGLMVAQSIEHGWTGLFEVKIAVNRGGFIERHTDNSWREGLDEFVASHTDTSWAKNLTGE